MNQESLRLTNSVKEIKKRLPQRADKLPAISMGGHKMYSEPLKHALLPRKGPVESFFNFEATVLWQGNF